MSPCLCGRFSGLTTALDNTLSGALGRWSLAHTVRAMFRPDKADFDQALHALASVGLVDQRHVRVAELSGGQQQRVAIARVLMQDPQVILADEPVASLDPGLAESIIDLLTRVASEGGRTLLVSLHRVDLALAHFARIVALRAGTIEFDVASADVNDALLTKLYAMSDVPGTDEHHENRVPPILNCVR